MFEFIIDPDGKERRVKNLEVISHEVVDAVTGEMVPTRFVQVTVLGKNREWPNWYPLDVFKEMNPDIKVGE